MSYKGYVTCSTVNVYKRGKSTSSIPEGKLDFGYFEYYVGEFEKVVPNLDEYSVLYYGDDVEQKHPVYRLNNPTDKKLEIDLGGEKVSTLLINDDKYINMSDGETYSDKVVGIGFYPEGNQNFGYNFKAYSDNVTGAVPVNDRYNKYKSGTAERIYWDVTGCALYRNKKNYEEYFVNGDIDGLTAYYKPDLDCMIAPGFSPNSQMVEYFDITATKVYMKSSFRGFNSNVANSLIASGFATNRYVPAYGQFQLLNDTGEYTTFYPPIFCDPAVPLNFIAGNAYVDSRYQAKTIPFFLKDKQGEYWLMYTIYGGVYGDRNLVQDNVYRDVILMKVKDMPTTYLNAVNDITTANPSSLALTWITSAEYADPKTIDNTLDLIFSVPDVPNYSDDGPDIVGPGKDPYDGILDNTDDMVGGEPNIEDKIEQDDGTYNDSGSIIRGWGSFYGSYVLNQGTLAQYVNTLTWLNSKWGSLLWPVYSLMSDRIKNNTINLIHLPFRVPNTNVEQRPFTVGNTAIMQSTTDATAIKDWEFGRITGIATANLLQKEITTDVVNLGVLGHYYDNFLDFAPYSSASLYIPYIGTVELPINLIQSTSEGEQKQLQLLFRINNSTGDMIVLLQVNGSTVKQWSGNCARDIQISVDATGGVLRSMSNTIVGGVLGGTSLAGAVATAAAKGGLSGADYQVQKEMYDMASPEMRKDTTWGQTTGARLEAYENKQHAARAAGNSVVNSVQKATEVNSFPVPNHSIGNMPVAGEIGFMGPQEVRLIVERPIIWRPKDYGDLIGYPTKKIAKLGSVKGFARVSDIHLRCNATLAEKTEIEQMLNAGVIFSDN